MNELGKRTITCAIIEETEHLKQPFVMAFSMLAFKR